ncbi:hypothetical protein ACU18_07300 [Arthrobacter sp. ZBG10]|uniref:hypothetical protein n=1 Tax=Arthrobacter sp. ZBG10 TaxID=1676590 RepID=UPI0006A54E9A|nr:hypothetical protein [Arthrobacter sp. ZBG10]KNH18538.1 hypothetical protein ACU18_07300 [Arthrobacter sp. ZBG10]
MRTSLPPKRWRRIPVIWSAALLALGLLAGCSGGETGLQRDTARQLQERVLEVTQASAKNDPAAALKALDSLDAELDAALAKGQISTERHKSVTTIADGVRADLQADLAAAQKAAEDARIAAEKAAAEKAAAEKAATEPPAPAPSPETIVPAPAATEAPAPDPGSGNSDSNSGDNGNDSGSNNGNGNDGGDKGKGKDKN